MSDVAAQLRIECARTRINEHHLRHPWDDGVFAALADRHGMRVDLLMDFADDPMPDPAQTPAT